MFLLNETNVPVLDFTAQTFAFAKRSEIAGHYNEFFNFETPNKACFLISIVCRYTMQKPRVAKELK